MPDLAIASVDFFPLENARVHHTDRYEVVHLEPPTPVLRRGLKFKLRLAFEGRGYDATRDLIRLLFTFGANPSPMKGTKGVAVLSPRRNQGVENWDVVLTSNDKESIILEVTSPPDCPVGNWQFTVESKEKDPSRAKGRPTTYTYPQDIYLLFNPWNKGDQVYMESEHHLDEYILNDVGKIWVGPWGSSRGREWVFGQFDSSVLPAVMLLMERTNLTGANRGNPILVTRAISKLVNSNDDLGVLMGRWDGNYEDGTAPAAWTGSVPILEQYLETGQEVKYGQCWVFAGVVTTVCRALGIPSRVVSNLVSAHDANSSLTVDRYFDKENEEMGFDPNNPTGDEDSIWNYHVWNDVWMARPDLPKGYGGWQAIDATPQEPSEGMYQCGPASVEAIRCGAVGFNYDVPFMLATVNADLIRWKEDEECDLGFSKIDCNKYHIGRMILTKKPWIFDPNGDKDREEVTDQYKAREGSKAERLALMNGVRGVERAKRFFMLPSKSKEDLEFELVDIETVNIGEPFSVTVNINNKSSTLRKVQAVLSAASVYYTGIRAHLIKKASGDFEIQPNSKESLRLKVKPEEYLDKLVEYCQMKIFAIATVEDSRETWADEDDFQVLTPNLTIKVGDDPVVNNPVSVTLSFKNPLKKTLTNCKFRCEGPGLTKQTVISYRDIEPLEDVRVEHRFSPLKSGKHKLIGTFSSKELIDITGSAELEVYGDEE